MMSTRPTILAINPGTRYLGIAVLNGSDLVDWGVRVIEGMCSPAKLDKALAVVSDLILDHEPDILALKKTHRSRTSRQLDELCARIEALAQEQWLQISRYSIEKVKAWHISGTRANKMTLAELVSLKYPALTRTLVRERSSANPYHARMFEAVAVGMAEAARNKPQLLRQLA